MCEPEGEACGPEDGTDTRRHCVVEKFQHSSALATGAVTVKCNSGLKNNNGRQQSVDL